MSINPEDDKAVIEYLRSNKFQYVDYKANLTAFLLFHEPYTDYYVYVGGKQVLNETYDAFKLGSMSNLGRSIIIAGLDGECYFKNRVVSQYFKGEWYSYTSFESSEMDINETSYESHILEYSKDSDTEKLAKDESEMPPIFEHTEQTGRSNPVEISSDSNSPSTRLPMRCITKNLNVRAEPFIYAEIIAQLSMDDYIDFTGKKHHSIFSASINNNIIEGQFIEIMLSNIDKSGWVFSGGILSVSEEENWEER